MDRRAALHGGGCLLLGLLAGCLESGSGESGPQTSTATGSPAGPTLGEPPILESSAFAAGETIPDRYTCVGQNDSPPLTVTGVSSQATSLALLVDDPDAPGGTFTHWLLWGLPASTVSLPAAVPHDETVPSLSGAKQGTNDAGRVGYSGPCPPEGDGPHRYRFRLIALGVALDLAAGADREAFDEAIADVPRTHAVLQATYER